jgi:hypothetical protein
VRNPYVRKIPSILSSPPLPSAPLSSPAPSSVTPAAPGAVDAGTVVGYHHVEDDSRYRASWLPRDLSGVPPFIPAEVSAVDNAAGRLTVTTLLSPPLSLDTTLNEVRVAHLLGCMFNKVTDVCAGLAFKSSDGVGRLLCIHIHP